MAGVFQAKNGKVAIWTGAQDDAPFDNPLGNINRVKFHSSLDYLQIIDERVFTLNLPPISGTLERVASYQIGAHGRPGAPLFFAHIVVGGVPVAFSGSVPVHQSANGDSFARWLAIGASATHFIVHEYSIQGGIPGAPVGMTNRPAQSFSVRCYIMDEML